MKAFSELTSASQVNNEDLLAISQTSGSGYASKKTTVKDITDKSNLNLAEEYDSTSSYAVGDYCIYESVLYKCTASTTGSFDNTKWTSVVVTDEMGSGGGGTGGHTIIDENGNSMTARAGLQFVGGANVSDDSTNNKTIVDLASAGGIDGVFIDTENVIVATTVFTTDLSYTAIEDCIFVGDCACKQNENVTIKINTKTISVGNNTAYQTYMPIYIPLRKGQTITIENVYASWASHYTVYGIQTGTTHSKFQPVIYSTEEREVGVWTDGKPLYQKTFIYSSGFTSGNNTFQFDISSYSIIREFDVKAYDNNSSPYTIGEGNEIEPVNANYERIVINIASGTVPYIASIAVTILYTKTTDVAGSGTWTPQGVPAVHYSTDEQIIGTWMGETLYQKSFYSDSALSTHTSISHGISNLDLVIDCKCCIRTSNKSYQLPITTNQGVAEIDITPTNIDIDLSSQYVSIRATGGYSVTIQYTKSS